MGVFKVSHFGVDNNDAMIGFSHYVVLNIFLTCIKHSFRGINHRLLHLSEQTVLVYLRVYRVIFSFHRYGRTTSVVQIVGMFEHLHRI